MFGAIVLASEGGNSFILPHDINEIIWGSSAFLIVMGLLIWKGGPAIRDAWNGRIDRIASEISDAEQVRTEAEASLAEVQSRIANADVERQRIHAEATETAAALKAQIAARTETDAEELRVRGLADAESSKSQVVADLQAEIAALAVGAAEAVVVRNLDGDTQAQLIDAFIRDLGTAGAVTGAGGQQ